MVQLRSDRWYSRAGQYRVRRQLRPAGGGSRRLLSLGVLLVLVFWVMQKSADPQAYERAFRYLGVPFEEEPGASRTAFGATQGDKINGASKSAPPVSAAGSSLGDTATVTLIPAGSGESGKAKGATDSNALDKSNSTVLEDGKVASETAEKGAAGEGSGSSGNHQTSLTENSVPDWGAVWDALDWNQGDIRQAARIAFSPTLHANAEVIAAEISKLKWSSTEIELATQIAVNEQNNEFMKWLDTRLIRDLKDGSPWRGTESEVFYRLLRRGNDWDRVDADALMVLSYPALKEAVGSSRGEKLIRFRGFVERAKINRPQDALFDIDSYWTVWLRPSDSTARPVVAYLTRLPKAISAEKMEGFRGEIEVFGLPAKLVAYNAVEGIELAPSICGIASDYVVDVSPNQSAQANTSAKNVSWYIPVSLAALLGGMWVAWIWFGSRPNIQTSADDESGGQVGDKKTRFVLGSNKKNITKLFWLTVFLSGTEASIVNQSAYGWQVADQPNTDNKEPALTTEEKLLASRLSRETIDELVAYGRASDESITVFPDSLGRVIFAADQLGRTRLTGLVEKASHPGLGWQIAKWSGWVTECKIIPLSAVQQEWMEGAQVYRLSVEVELEGKGEIRGFLYVRRAPSQWLNAKQLRQPFQAAVIELLQDPSAASSEPGSSLAIAPDVRWVAMDSADVQEMRPEISEDWKRLAASGWDLANIDLLKRLLAADLSYEDRDGFYSLLSIAKDLGAKNEGEVKWQTMKQPELLLRNPAQWIGKQISIKGRIARVTRVPIESEEIRRTVNADFYYELDGFIRLEGRKIEVRPPVAIATAEGQTMKQRTEVLVYEDEFPMTLVTLQLPQSMQTGAADSNGVPHQSWELQQWIDVRGIFYRTWSYRSEYVSRADRRERQMAPLIVAASIQPSTISAERPNSPGSWTGWLVVGTIFFLVVVIWGFVIADWKNVFRKYSIRKSKR